jgi:hypothetical protein
MLAHKPSRLSLVTQSRFRIMQRCKAGELTDFVYYEPLVPEADES